MNFCQRLLRDAFDFHVSEVPDESACGKPAQFRYKFADETDREVVLWLCAGCFDEYELRFGEGSWAEEATGSPEDTRFDRIMGTQGGV